jgi:hypothetical protein
MAEEYAEREYEKPVKKGEGIAKANRTEDGKLKYTEVIVLFKDGESKLFKEEDFEEFFDIDEYAKGGELEMGIETEMKEHGMSKAEATKTAKDHLRENPNYYTKMKKAGLEDGGELTLFAEGGATFDDKVRAIKRNLVGKKVPKDYQGEYGKKYDKDEAEESARRIAGAMRKNYKK